MDRSFLSNVDVIEASRDFVCMRLATFEDAGEAKFLKKVYGRNGALENTVYAILDPSGKNLTRASRGPRYRNPSQLVKLLEDIAKKYDGANKLWSDARLPEMKNVTLAINVASCDSLPVLLAVGQNETELQQMREQLLPLTWNNDFAGQFVVATATVDANLKALRGVSDSKSGVYLLDPDKFGLSARLLGSIELTGDSEAQLRQALAKFEPSTKNHRQHVQTGFALGLKWETAIPVTDAQARSAAKRLWGE